MQKTDTISYSHYITRGGAGTYIIDDTITPDNPATVLGISFVRGVGTNDMDLMSGNTLIFKNFTVDTGYIEMNFLATDTLKIIKSGSDKAFFLVNYVKRDLTTQKGYSQGELLSSFFLFLLVLGFSFGFLVKNFIKRQ